MMKCNRCGSSLARMTAKNHRCYGDNKGYRNTSNVTDSFPGYNVVPGLISTFNNTDSSTSSDTSSSDGSFDGGGSSDGSFDGGGSSDSYR